MHNPDHLYDVNILTDGRKAVPPTERRSQEISGIPG